MDNDDEGQDHIYPDEIRTLLNTLIKPEQTKFQRWSQHLDVCTRCRTRPFDLCPAGAKILISP